MAQSQSSRKSTAAATGDPFALLSVPYTATPAEVTAAFRKAALATHPDTNPGEDGAAFRAARAAYDALRTAGQIDAERKRWGPAPDWIASADDFLRGAGFNPQPVDFGTYVNLALFPQCQSISDHKTRRTGLGVHNPPANWAPGTASPLNGVLVWRVEASPGRAGGLPYGVWLVVGFRMTYVFGPDSLSQ